MTSRYSFDSFVPLLDTATDDLDIHCFLDHNNQIFKEQISLESPRQAAPQLGAGLSTPPSLEHSQLYTLCWHISRGWTPEFRKFLAPPNRQAGVRCL